MARSASSDEVSQAPICNELPLPPFGFRPPPAVMLGDAVSHLQNELDFSRQVEQYRAELDVLQRKQEQMDKRQKDADEVRRGQLDSLSERIYQVEKDLSAAKQQQEEAIDKANAAFQMHSYEVQRDRQALMNLIGQINDKFEDVRQELSQQGMAVQATQQSFADLQQELQTTMWDTRGDQAAMASLRQDVTWLQQKVNEQQDSLNEAQMSAEAAEELDSTHTEKFSEMSDKLRTLSGRMSETEQALQAMKPQLVELSRRDGQEEVHHVSQPEARQRSRRNKCPDNSEKQLASAPGPSDSNGGRQSQSPRSRSVSQSMRASSFSHIFADFEVPHDTSEPQTLSDGGSISSTTEAFQTWGHVSREPAASDVPSTSIARPSFGEQQAIHNVHQASEHGASSSPEYQFAHGVAPHTFSPHYSGPGYDSWAIPRQVPDSGEMPHLLYDRSMYPELSEGDFHL